MTNMPNWPIAVLFVGSEGMLITQLEVVPPRYELFPKEKSAGFQPPPQTIPNTIGHANEWIAACKTGSPTTCSLDYSGPLTETVLLGNVAYRAGQKLQWDPDCCKNHQQPPTTPPESQGPRPHQGQNAKPGRQRPALRTPRLWTGSLLGLLHG